MRVLAPCVLAAQCSDPQRLLIVRVIPISAHAAFDKGAAYMGLKVHTIPVDPETRQVNVKRVARAINPNTILVSHVSSSLG